MHEIVLWNVLNVYKLPHVSTARCYPKEVSTTKQLKLQYVTVETQNEILGYLKCKNHKIQNGKHTYHYSAVISTLADSPLSAQCS